MAAKIVELESRRFKPHSSGEARCLACGHEWAAVAPIGINWFECPSCHTMRGCHKYHYQRQDDLWTCQCGNDLFFVTRDGIYCPNCGLWQKIV